MQPLPRKIASSHSICDGEHRADKVLDAMFHDEADNEQEEQAQKDIFMNGMRQFLSQEYEEAFKCFDMCQDTYLPAKYQLAVMYYDGLGREENHVSVSVYCSLPSLCIGNLFEPCANIFHTVK